MRTISGDYRRTWSTECSRAAARGIVNRAVTGTIKQLLVQRYVRHKIVKLEWVPRKENPADALTHVTGEFNDHMSRLMQIFPAVDP